MDLSGGLILSRNCFKFRSKFIFIRESFLQIDNINYNSMKCLNFNTLVYNVKILTC